MLQHKKLQNCAFVSYKQQMASRFQKRRENVGKRDYDPLIIEDFDWNNEWANTTVELPQDARGLMHDLTWDNIDVAVGASQAHQGLHCWKYALEAIIKRLLLYFLVHDNCLLFML